MSVETRTQPRSGGKSANHQTAKNPTKYTLARSKNRVCELTRRGMQGRPRFANQHGPQPEDHQGVEHNEAFPKIQMGEVEPGLIVLAEVIKADNPQHVNRV